MQHLLGFFLLMPAVLFMPAAHAGYRFVADDGTETVISEGRMRVSIPAIGYMRGYDGAGGRLWMANTKTRTFWQGTADEYCQDAKRTRDARMERQTAQRGMVEQYTKPPASNPVKVTIERTEERSTIVENMPDVPALGGSGRT